ncbi:transposase [Nocardia gipuzkoensis]|uniref:transposase n=1 Tax=Nocardia gipuzkoensis TaxID=2749991 RepID=UPI001E32740A|nr:transposase [Nocardia gipuzkoensis]UGT72379.1 transposase [Nocardia gipuzkoensis]
MHLVTDGHGRGLAVLFAPGQAGDSPILAPLLEAVAVPRFEGGPPRRNPQVLIADKAYSSAADRALLRRKRIRTVIPERSDQTANCQRRGRRGGRAPDFDRETYKRRNVIERAFNKAEHWRAVATRYDECVVGGLDFCLCHRSRRVWRRVEESDVRGSWVSFHPRLVVVGLPAHTMDAIKTWKSATVPTRRGCCTRPRNGSLRDPNNFGRACRAARGENFACDPAHLPHRRGHCR